jgi:hypothetical protein
MGVSHIDTLWLWFVKRGACVLLVRGWGAEAVEIEILITYKQQFDIDNNYPTRSIEHSHFPLRLCPVRDWLLRVVV